MHVFGEGVAWALEGAAVPKAGLRPHLASLAENAHAGVSEKLFQKLLSLGVCRTRPVLPTGSGCLPGELAVRQESCGGRGVPLPACPASWIQGYFFLKDMTKGDQ